MTHITKTMKVSEKKALRKTFGPRENRTKIYKKHIMGGLRVVRVIKTKGSDGQAM